MVEVDENWEETSTEYSMSYDDWYNNEYYDWLRDRYDSYSSEYLRYIYETRFSDSYDSYYDWYSVSGSVWDTPDYDFENWLFNESGYYDSKYSLYEEETERDVKVDCNVKVNVSVKEGVGFSIKDAKHDNLFDWEKSDFRNFAEDFEEELDD